jgi:Ni/Fe-hydrogenase subunit HybB-like protein
MFEHIFRGSKNYYTLVAILLGVIAIGFYAYMRQYFFGIGLTGMSRSVAWGLYIGQLTFLVGIAASAVMVVLPYYLHDYKAFGKITLFGEFLAIGSVCMIPLFVLVDLGQPGRLMNLFLHPSLNSMLFWDTVVIFGYLIINVIISRVMYESERKDVAPPTWIKYFIFLSIPWAISIHTVTAFLYAGLEGRPFWLTAILAPRFLASAFAGGPSVLILLLLILKKFTTFDPGTKALNKLSQIVAYAMVINVFFIGLEFFTGLYSDMPHHLHHFEFMYFGVHGEMTTLSALMWISALLSIVTVGLLVYPKTRKNHDLLGYIAIGVVIALWLEKGYALVVVGQTPDQTGHLVMYTPSLNEIAITFGIYAIGGLIITVLFKVGLSIRESKSIV